MPRQCIFHRANTFKLRDNKTIIAGVLPSGAKLSVADAHKMEFARSVAGFRRRDRRPCPWWSASAVKPGQPVYLALQQLSRDGQQNCRFIAT